MSTQRVPPSSTNTFLETSSFSSQSSSLPLWERLSRWASENKAVIYTIAGVAVVISGAGAVYYLSDSRKSGSNDASEGTKRTSKRDRRKVKKEKGKEEQTDFASNQPAQRDEQGAFYPKLL